MKLLAAVFLILLGTFAFSQGMPTAAPVVVNQDGVPVLGALVTICNTNPGTGSCSSLVTTYTDQTLGTSCTGTLRPLNALTAPTIGSGCSNPGFTDNHGNAVAFTQVGFYWCQYSAPTIVTYSQPCPAGSSTGGGGGSITGSGTINTITKFTGPTAVGNSSMSDDGVNAVQSPNGMNVVGGSYSLQYPNSPNGTTNNLLACIDSTVTTVSEVTTCPVSTLEAIGIVHNGAGTTGNPAISQSAFDNCIFDNQTVIGDIAVPSATVAGQCDDAGPVRPAGTQAIGRITTVNGGASTAAGVQIFSLDISAPGGGGGSTGTITSCASGSVNAYYAAAGTTVSCDTAVGDDGVGNVTSHSLGTTDATLAGFFYAVAGADPSGSQPANSVMIYAPTSVTGTPKLALPNSGSGGTIASNATSPIVVNASTGNISCPTCGTGSGSVSSVGLTVNSTSPSGIFTVTGSPVTTTGTLNFNLAGTSGGIPYFSSGTVLSSSGALTLNAPVIGGGAGASPTVGSRSGNTTTFGTTSGSLTSGHDAGFDASGNIVDNGAHPTGTVTSIATTSPITGGTITSTGTIACATCVTASSPGLGYAHFAGSTQAVTSVTLPRGLVFTIGDPSNSSALTVAATTTAYLTVPFGCTISAYNLVIDAGTITVKFWKVATGTAIPTSGNSISTSGVGISTGTAIHSTTTSDFTTTTVTANDIMAMNVTAVATAKYVQGVLQCDQSQ